MQRKPLFNFYLLLATTFLIFVAGCAKAPKVIIGQDGAEMILIPAGEFLMGSPEEGEGSADEHPQHTVFLDAFYIDKYEVTNSQYKQFMRATGHRASLYWNSGEYNQPNQPVVGVDWHDAVAYAKWAGKRLPTEAEWEKAARGTDGRKYPWGTSGIAQNATQRCLLVDTKIPRL